MATTVTPRQLLPLRLCPAEGRVYRKQSTRQKSHLITIAIGSLKYQLMVTVVFLTTTLLLPSTKLHSNMRFIILLIDTLRSIFEQNQYPHPEVTGIGRQIQVTSKEIKLLISRWHWYQTLQDKSVMKILPWRMSLCRAIFLKRWALSC